MNTIRQIRLHLCLAIFLIVSFLGYAHGQPPPAMPPTPIAVSQPLAADSATEIAVLKAQLGTMQAFTDRLLATVYWSLGSLVVVAGLMVGFGWVSSVRMHDRDISAIRSELTAQLTSQLASAREGLDKTLQAGIAEVSTASSASATASVTKEVDPIKREVTSLAASVERLRIQVAYAQLQTTAWYWEGRGVPANEFTQYHSLLEIAAKEEDANQISTTLKRLTELTNSGTSLFITTLTKLTALLDTLPTQYALSVGPLREALRRTNTY